MGQALANSTRAYDAKEYAFASIVFVLVLVLLSSRVTDSDSLVVSRQSSVTDLYLVHVTSDSISISISKNFTSYQGKKYQLLNYQEQDQ